MSTFHETQSFTYSSAIYKCNLHDRTSEWSRVRNIGDQTLFVSKHFNESFSGTSVSKYKENKIYMSEPVRKMDPRPIYFGFWCLMTNTTKLD